MVPQNQSTQMLTNRLFSLKTNCQLSTKGCNNKTWISRWKIIQPYATGSILQIYHLLVSVNLLHFTKWLKHNLEQINSMLCVPMSGFQVVTTYVNLGSPSQACMCCSHIPWLSVSLEIPDSNDFSVNRKVKTYECISKYPF